MNQIDTFGIYVRRRLEHWGEVFALHKDCEYLGHQSKNMLQILIEHRGEMPERTQGFKPMDIMTRHFRSSSWSQTWRGRIFRWHAFFGASIVGLAVGRWSVGSRRTRC